MRRSGRWALAALCLAAAASWTAAEPPGENGRLWTGIFGKSKEDPKKLPGPPTKTPDERALEQDRLMKAYLRRLAVCDKLRDVALDTNNPKLSEEADRLEQMAWKVYEKQAARVLNTAAMDEPMVDRTKKPAGHTAASLGARGGLRGPVPARMREEER